ncbi:unnamed protein product [Linum trigynum]|uniref:Uncharacterized protein n=1 Tax=Linum trigynum TaxID=586398 RepID=A0AAV2D5D6_9ROSI
MDTQQINMDELKQMVIEAIQATFQPKFDRIQRRIEELKLLTDKVATPKKSVLQNPIQERHHERSIPIKLTPAIDECIRKLAASWDKAIETSSGPTMEKEGAANRLCFPPAKQRLRSEEADVELEDDSNDVTAAGELLGVKEKISPTAGTLDQKVITEFGYAINFIGVECPCFRPTQQSLCLGNDLELEDGWKEVNTAYTFHIAPGMNSLSKIAAKHPQTETPNSAKSSLRTKEFDFENGYLVGEIEHESSQMNTGNKLLDDHGRCSITETSPNRPEFRIPNFSLDVLRSRNLTPDDGGKNAGDGLSPPMNYRGLEAIEKFISMMEQADSSSILQIGGSNPCGSTFDNFPEFVAKLGSMVKVLATFPRLIIVDIDQGSDVDYQMALYLTKSSLNGNKDEGSENLKNGEERLGCTFEDPFWVPSDHILACKIIQALRSKLFEEGEPDMIPNRPLYKLELLDGKASSSCLKNVHFCLSHFPCSSSQFWRQVSLNWLNGNSILMACIEHGVIIYTLVCLVAQEDVIKVVFQSLKVATSKLENCQKISKAENCVEIPTLKAYIWSLENDLGLFQVGGERGSFLLQRKGIG